MDLAIVCGARRWCLQRCQMQRVASESWMSGPRELSWVLIGSTLRPRPAELEMFGPYERNDTSDEGGFYFVDDPCFGEVCTSQ